MYQPHRPSQRSFVDLRDQRYHLHSWGAPRAGASPSLVLLHGWMDVGASYQFMVDALADDFVAGRRIVAPDWRGFGHSTSLAGAAPDHYDFTDYLGDLDALLDELAPGEAVDLVGHSMGGNVAMLYAGTRPQRIRRLVNLEGFGMPATRASEAPARHARWLDEIGQVRRGELALRDYADLSGVAERLTKTNPRLPREKAEWLALQWSEERVAPGGGTRRVILGEAAHRVVNPQLWRVEEVVASYGRIAAPTLMVEAEDDSLAGWWQDRFTRAEFHQRLAAVPDVRRERLAGCGHMLHHDQPQALAALLTAFVTAA